MNLPAARLAREEIKNFFLRTASDLRSAMENAERSQRGFLITGHDVYLEPYESAKQHVPQLLDDLQQATSTTPLSNARCLNSKPI